MFFWSPCAFLENTERAGSLPISASNEGVIPKMKRGRRPLRAHEVNQTTSFQRVPESGKGVLEPWEIKRNARDPGTFPYSRIFGLYLRDVVKSVRVLY